MTERERLIDILNDFPIFYSTMKERWMPQAVERLADHLLRSGVIVPPCKVGDACYPLWHSRSKPIVERKISRITYSARNIIIGYYENDGQYRPPLRTRVLDVDVFLSREDAEKALKEREAK